MKQLLTFILIIVIAHASAQSSGGRKDSIAVFALLNKAEKLMTEEQYDSAIVYCDKATAMARAANYKHGEAYSVIQAADVYISKEDFDKAETTAVAVNKLGLQMKDSLVTAIGMLQQAQAIMYKEKNEAAINLFEKALDYYLARHPHYYSCLAYNDLGYTWGRIGDHKKQTENLLKAISLYEKHFPEDYANYATSLNNLSTVYYSLNDRPKAIEYAKKSLHLREKAGTLHSMAIICCNLSQMYIGVDSTEMERYLKLCVQYSTQSKNESRIVHAYITASLNYAYNKRYQEALEYELKAIDFLEKKNNNPQMLLRRYIAAGTAYAALKMDTAITIAYFKKAFAILSANPDKQNFRDYYYQATVFYKDCKNFAAAYDNYKKYILYRDSIVNEKTQTSIAALTAQYETEKKDNDISRLTTSQKLKELQIQKQQAELAGNAALAKQKQTEINLLEQSQELRDVTIKQQEEVLAKQLLLTKTSEQQLKINTAEKLAQEKQLKNEATIRYLLIGGIGLILVLAATFFNRFQLKKKLEQQKTLLAMRNNISQDLHDDIGASLSSISILNEMAKRNLDQPEKSAGYLAKTGEDIQRISESLSDIVWNINPRYDDLQNLFVRMKRYAADLLEAKQIQGEFQFPSTDIQLAMDMTQRRNLYLVFKEAINNLAKYSGAANAVIQIMADQQQINMLIKDDGKGFDSSIASYGNGLRNMEQRAKENNAALQITSAPGEGTTVILKMKVT